MASGLTGDHQSKYTVANWRDEFLQHGSDNRERKRFEARAAMLSQGAKANEYLAEALRIGPPFTGGARRARGTET